MKTIVLLSGGVDSTLLAHRAHKAGELAACIFVDYGQPAAAMERGTALKWCNRRKVQLIVRKVRLPITSMTLGPGRPGARVVPLRNLVLLSLAASYAVEMGAEEVQYGAIGDDYEDYEDCRPEWVEDLNVTLEHSGVRIEAPLIALSKQEVVDTARREGVDVGACWSCYEPVGWKPCGKCNSCRARLACLQDAS